MFFLRSPDGVELVESGKNISQIIYCIMKILVLLGLVILNLCPVYAQPSLRITYNDTHAGRNISLLISRVFNESNEAGIGLRYNINKLTHNDDQNNAFWNRLYATKFYHHIGVDGFYQRYIFRNLKLIKPFLAYDIQASYSTTRNHLFSPYAYDNNGDVLYRESLVIFGPFTFIEQYFGLGYTVNFIDNIHLYMKAGFGIMFIIGKDIKSYITYDSFNWEFAEIISTGIVYRFPSKD